MLSVSKNRKVYRYVFKCGNNKGANEYFNSICRDDMKASS